MGAGRRAARAAAVAAAPSWAARPSSVAASPSLGAAAERAGALRAGRGGKGRGLSLISVSHAQQVLNVIPTCPHLHNMVVASHQEGPSKPCCRGTANACSWTLRYTARFFRSCQSDHSSCCANPLDRKGLLPCCPAGLPPAAQSSQLLYLPSTGHFAVSSSC